MSASSGHKVAEGTQVHYRGTTYVGGETVPFPAQPVADDAALRDHWLTAGWIVPPPTKTARKS